MFGFEKDAQKKIIRSLNRHLLVIFIFLVVGMVAAQFLILATVGSKGTEISHIRAEKERLRIENEALRSEIDKAKTLEKIQDNLRESYTLVPKKVNSLYLIELPADSVISSARN